MTLPLNRMFKLSWEIFFAGLPTAVRTDRARIKRGDINSCAPSLLILNALRAANLFW
jgi:hypothetical protein